MTDVVLIGEGVVLILLAAWANEARRTARLPESEVAS